MFPSYRNQSDDLPCKPTDWFLYDGNIGRLRVKFCVNTSNRQYFEPFDLRLMSSAAEVQDGGSVTSKHYENLSYDAVKIQFSV